MCECVCEKDYSKRKTWGLEGGMYWFEKSTGSKICKFDTNNINLQFNSSSYSYIRWRLRSSSTDRRGVDKMNAKRTKHFARSSRPRFTDRPNLYLSWLAFDYGRVDYGRVHYGRVHYGRVVWSFFLIRCVLKFFSCCIVLTITSSYTSLLIRIGGFFSIYKQEFINDKIGISSYQLYYVPLVDG